MKKIFYSIILMVFILLPSNVFADGNITVSPNSLTIESGSSTTITLSAYNAIGDVSIESKDNNIAVVDTNKWFTGMVEEKETKTGVIKITGKGVGTTEIIFNIDGASFDEEDISSTKKVTVTVVPAKSSNNNLSSIKIDNVIIDKFSSTTTMYMLKDTTSSSITISASSEDSKASISGLGKKELSYGLNTIDIEVRAEDGSKKTYTIKITRIDNRSNEKSLASLTVSPKNINFDSNKTSYNLVVDYNVKEVKIDALAKDSKASISGIGTYKLEVGTNTVDIIVTAEDGSKKMYTIKITRKDKNGDTVKLSKDNLLKSLEVAGYDINFDKNKDTYYLNVDKNVDNIDIIANSNDSKAKVKINNIDKLIPGENTITIEVTAEDGSVKIYKIIVNKDNDIPKITLDKLLETIDTDSNNIIIVDIKDDNNIISKEMLEKLKLSNKKLIVNKYIEDKLLYTWEIDGKDIKEFIDINTVIEFYSSSDNKINELLNNSKYIYFNNNLDTSVFDSIILKIYNNDQYNSENIYGYTYSNQQLVLKYNNLEYNSMYLEIKNLDKGIYVITDKDIFLEENKKINDNSNNIILKIVIVSIILIIFILGLIILFKKKRKKNG